MTMRRIAIAASLALVSLLARADTALDPAKSRIEAEFTQMGVPVSAPFTRFGGSIRFDAAKPAEAHAQIEIDTASLDIGDDAYNAEVRKKEWFDSSRYPKAIFDATGLKPVGSGGRFETTGKLSLKGRVRELKVTVNLKPDGKNSIFDGMIPISRKDFDIGDAAWKDTVEDTVKVSFHLVVPAAR
ncbi:MAG: hypothetical protein NVS9B10_07880 [Nevskia sp.]